MWYLQSLAHPFLLIGLKICQCRMQCATQKLTSVYSNDHDLIARGLRWVYRCDLHLVDHQLQDQKSRSSQEVRLDIGQRNRIQSTPKKFAITTDLQACTKICLHGIALQEQVTCTSHTNTLSITFVTSGRCVPLANMWERLTRRG